MQKVQHACERHGNVKKTEMRGVKNGLPLILPTHVARKTSQNKSRRPTIAECV